MNPKDLKPGERCAVRRGIYAYRTKEGRLRYGISYSYRGSLHKEIVGPTIRGAEQALAVRRAEIAQGRFQIHTRAVSPVFNAFADQFLEWSKANKKSWRTDKNLLRTLRSSFGLKRLDEITSWQVEQYKAKRRETVSPRTVNMGLSILRRMFNLSIAWGSVVKNPVTCVKMMRDPERPMRVLSPQEQTKLLEVCRPHLKDLILFALHTGMRKGEILGLRWSAVDLEQGVITVGGGKTGRLRSIPVNAVCRTVLERRKSAGGEFVFEWQGKRFDRFDKTWRATVAAAQIPPIRFHDLRHTFATRLVLAGEDLVTVGELLGHRSIQMTIRYSHPGPEHRRAAVEKLEGIDTRTKLARRRKRSGVRIR